MEYTAPVQAPTTRGWVWNERPGAALGRADYAQYSTGVTASG